MPDRIASDHPSIETYRCCVIRRGGRRRRIELPPDAGEILPLPGVIRVRVDERTRFGRCRLIGDTPTIVGLYRTHAAAAGTDGTDVLTDWLQANDIDRGSSVLLDCLEPRRRIGLRPPGEHTVYPHVSTLDSSLQSLAADILDESTRD